MAVIFGIVGVISAVLRVLGLVKAAEGLLEKFGKPAEVKQLEEKTDVQKKQLEIANAPDPSVGDVSRWLSGGGSGP